MLVSNENTINTYITKVNKIYVRILVFGAIASLVLTIMSVYSTYIPFTALTTGACISAILIYKKTSGKAIMAILLISVNIALFAYIADLPESMTGYSMMGLCIISVYFDRWLILIYGVISCGILTYLQFAKHVLEFKDYSAQLSCILFSFLILFFLTKWGKELIQTAKKEEEHASGLLAELKQTMGVVKTNTILVHAGIDNCNRNLGAVHEISNLVAATIQEMTKGVVEQTGSITEISNMINEADEKISNISTFTKQLSDESAKTSNVVLEGYQKISQMDKQMNIINHSVVKSFSIVQELSKSMDEVNNFLSNITQIANQTNLLALNAAIEAARAGEAGKGFAVVADEVRQLAEQSAKMVRNISQIINPIKNKVEDVLIEVQKGNGATQEGEAIVRLVNESFKRIQVSFTEMDKYISEEVIKIENTAVLLSNIREKTESIASISEQQAASTEELSATTEEHNANIENLYNIMSEIETSSNNLKDIIKQELCI